MIKNEIYWLHIVIIVLLIVILVIYLYYNMNSTINTQQIEKLTDEWCNDVMM